MDQAEITRRNEAIARYLEWPKNDSEEWNPIPCNTYLGDSLRFHRDWSWLMPVVEKISEQTGKVFHLFPKADDDGKHGCRFGINGRARGSTPIEAAWIAVSDYVLSLEVKCKVHGCNLPASCEGFCGGHCNCPA